MLVLQGQIGQKIIISHMGESMTLEPVAIRGDRRVRIGLTAPKSFTLDRESTHQRKMAAQGMPDCHGRNVQRMLANAIIAADISRQIEADAGNKEAEACYSRIADDLRRLWQDAEHVPQKASAQ
jgi:sRNA-binding carbon storage regulator CsrA